MVESQMPKSFVTYTYHTEQDIHEFTFSEASRRAVDAYVVLLKAMVERVINGEQHDRYLRALIDISQSGFFPLRYANERLKSLDVDFKDGKPPTQYVAYLSDNPVENSMIRNFMILNDGTRKIYTSAARAEALAWLCTCDGSEE